MVKNNVLKFIDSCVGSIARKIQDEFDESKHPRDKGGKFTSKGGEGRGGSKKEATNKKTKPVTMVWTGTEEDAERLAKKHGIDYKLVPGKGEDPYTHIELSGDNKKVKNFIVKEGFDGDEEEARKYVPGVFEETEHESERKNTPVKASESLTDNISDNLRQISENADSREEFIEQAKSYLEDYLLGDLADGDYAEENFEMSSEDVEAYVKDYIESGKLENVADKYYGKGDYSESAEEDDWERRKDKMRRGSRNRRTYE